MTRVAVLGISTGLLLTIAMAIVGYVQQLVLVGRDLMPTPTSGHIAWQTHHDVGAAFASGGDIGVNTVFETECFTQVVQVVNMTVAYDLLDADSETALIDFRIRRREGKGSVTLSPPSLVRERYSSDWIWRSDFVFNLRMHVLAGSSLRPAENKVLPIWCKSILPAEPADRGVWVRVTDGIGWPQIAFAGSVSFVPFTPELPYYAMETDGALLLESPDIWSGGWRGTIPAPWNVRMVPLRPVWPGLAVNVAFWTAAAWSAMLLFRCVRTLLRRRSLRCVACGYLLGRAGPSKCPECGSAVPSAPLFGRLR